MCAHRSRSKTTRQLTPEELTVLAKQLVDAPNQKEADKIKRQLVAGFYGSRHVGGKHTTKK